LVRDIPECCSIGTNPNVNDSFAVIPIGAGRIKNQVYSLIFRGAVIENPASRCLDFKCVILASHYTVSFKDLFRTHGARRDDGEPEE
jgi:hypothetical protein